MLLISKLPNWRLEFLGPDVYSADGMITMHDVPFLRNTEFMKAYRAAIKDLAPVFLNKGVPEWKDLDEIAWRSHITTWAAQKAKPLKGDFVECGVMYGVLSLAILDYLKFEESDNRTFWLVDTWEPMHSDTLQNIYPESLSSLNYFEYIKKRLERYSRVRFVRGQIPEVLRTLPEFPVAYLGIDMNDGLAELQALEHFWPSLVTGAGAYISMTMVMVKQDMAT